MRQRFLPILIGLFLPLASLWGQTGFSIDVKKPEPYEKRELKAEKTPTDKKIKAPKRFLQNLTTHYNYFFNANNKLNEVIQIAKESHRDDFSTLLPFYNYTLDATSAQVIQLDSVIFKAKTGIVMHDLRNDWVDNMYMLWGAAYFFRKQFDSAALMFQFINYAFADKEKDGYYKYIGSRMDGGNALTISSKEKGGIIREVFTEPPSRNDALVWQIRSMLQLNMMTEASSIISMLKADPNFPKRLQPELSEIESFYYYKQEAWDSSAHYLLKALDMAQTDQEKARWEYLAAQMLEKAGKTEKAQALYARALSDGTDPVMEVYTRLNLVRTAKEGENYIDENVAALVKMAKRDKYTDYRDVIYYMAAQLELERGNRKAAQAYLMKAVQNDNGNLSSKGKTFLLIADLAYDQKKYVEAGSLYDSVEAKDISEEDVVRMNTRKPPLNLIANHSSIVYRQDSIQRIAALPQKERDDYLNKLSKRLRKEQGLAEEAATVTSGGKPITPSLFPDPTTQQGPQKGEWYFYNENLKTTGFNQFKQTWGNRPNADKWRRFAEIGIQGPYKPRELKDETSTGMVEWATFDPEGPTYSSLLARLPLNEASLRKSNDSLNNALFSLGEIFVNSIEDYTSAVEVLEKVRGRDESFSKMEELLFLLYFSYNKLGNKAKAEEIKALMNQKFPSSNKTIIVSTGKNPTQQQALSTAATKEYERVYDLFIEGRFTEAKTAKLEADRKYGTTTWQPQLLYIESVYHIRNREDSLAKQFLQQIISQEPGSDMAKKAATMIDVLSRRAAIEAELTALQIQRPVEEEPKKIIPPVVEKKDTVAVVITPPVKEPTPPPVDTVAYNPAKRVGMEPINKGTATVTNPKFNPKTDTAAGKKIVQGKKALSAYRFMPTYPHVTVIILDKVDAIFTSEARNAFLRYNKERSSTTGLTVNMVDFDSTRKLLIIGEFVQAQDAIDYATSARTKAPSQIIPWLKKEKYSFTIISQENLELLMNKKDLEEYKKFLGTELPGRF